MTGPQWQKFKIIYHAINCDSLNAIKTNVQKYIGGAKKGSRILDNAVEIDCIIDIICTDNWLEF